MSDAAPSSPGDYGNETDPDGRFPSRSERDLALTAWLRRQEAMRTVDLHRLGFTEREIRGLVKHGDLDRPFRGVYADGRTPLSPRGRLRAAMLAVNGPAFFSHRTGAAVRGYRAVNPREIHISVVGQHTPKLPGLRLHRVGAMPSEVSDVAGLRAATLPLLILQFAATEDPDLADLIAVAARKQSLDPNLIESFIDGHPRVPGIVAMKLALADYRPAPEYNSNLEAEVHAWLGEHPEIRPPDETNVRIGPHEWDAIWHAERVAMEIDSRDWHATIEQKENDTIKDAFIQRRGYRVVRITGWRFRHDRMGFYDDLVALLWNAQAA